MKTIRLFFIALIVCFLLGIMSGCEKDTEVGPQGPAGPTGATGLQGNTNMITVYDTTSASSWVPDSIPPLEYHTFINVPNITQSVVDSGVVLVYMYGTDPWDSIPAPGWILLPAYFTEPVLSTIATYEYMVYYYAGGVTVGYRRNTFVNNPGVRIFKIVTIVP